MVTPKANSCVFVLPIITAPAFFSRLITVAFLFGMYSLYIAEPDVVLIPWVSIISLIPIGMPCNGPRCLPDFISLSAVLAALIAPCLSSVTYAFILGFIRSISSRQDSTISMDEISFSMIFSEI